jgi:hypothetical protein
MVKTLSTNAKADSQARAISLSLVSLLLGTMIAVSGAGVYTILGGIPAALANDQIASTTTSVNCTNPYNNEGEEKSVIAVLEAITKGLADRNFPEMKRHMDEACTTYNEKTKKLVQGRDNIIEDVQKRIADEEKQANAPIICYTIDRPFAKVTGDTAIANFYLVKELGGAHPQKYECHCTDVFVKRDGEWRKLHYRGGDWKLVKQ